MQDVQPDNRMSMKLGPASLEAIEVMKQQNIQMWPEQDRQPVMPKDISVYDSTELSKLFTELTAWSNFIAGQLAAAQVDEKYLENQKDMKEAKLFFQSDGEKVKGDTVSRVKAKVNSDETIIELSNNLMKAYAYRKMMEVVFNNFERDVSLVSREITRRTNDVRSLRGDRFSP